MTFLHLYIFHGTILCVFCVYDDLPYVVHNSLYTIPVFDTTNPIFFWPMLSTHPTAGFFCRPQPTNIWDRTFFPATNYHPCQSWMTPPETSTLHLQTGLWNSLGCVQPSNALLPRLLLLLHSLLGMGAISIPPLRLHLINFLCTSQTVSSTNSTCSASVI